MDHITGINEHRTPLSGDGGLFAHYFYSEEINSLFSEKNTIAFMLRFEAALAQAFIAGLLPWPMQQH